MHREFSNLSWGTIGSGARWLMSTTQIKKEIKYQIQHDPTSRIILPILQHPIQNLSCPHRPIYIRPVFGIPFLHIGLIQKKQQPQQNHQYQARTDAFAVHHLKLKRN